MFHILVILYILIIIILNFQLISIFGESPKFIRHVIIDNPHPGLQDIDILNLNNLTEIYSSMPIDLLAITYLSDGRKLNGTLWLYDEIYQNKHSDYIENNLTYKMNIRLETDIKQITYSIIISPSINKTWTKTVIEYEPNVVPFSPKPLPEYSSRIIETIYNYTDFLVDGNRYVNLSFDLAKIGYPEEYWINFESSVQNKNGIDVKDRTFSYRIPPAKNIVNYDWEKPIQIRAGTEASIKLYINSTDLQIGEIQKLNDSTPSDGIQISFTPNPVTVPQTGVNYTNMLIKVDKNFYNATITRANQIINISGMTLETITFSNTFPIEMEILPPYSLTELIGLWLRNNTITYVIPLGVTSIFIFWLSRKINQNIKHESIRVQDLLAVDASVIAGVLIFLTVGSSEIFSGNAIQQIGILTASIVFPFAIAAILTLSKGQVELYGVKFMIAGFIYLMVSVILIAFIQIKPILTN